MLNDSRLGPTGQQLILPTRRRVLGGLAAGTLAVAAPLPALASGEGAMRFHPPPIGSKWTYAYSDGRTEAFERLEDGAWVTWTVARYRREIDGEAPQTRSYNTVNGNWIVTFSETREALFAADPDDRRYRWPISVGGFWRSKYIYRDYRRQKSYDAYAAWSVKSFELVRGPNGPARTFRLVSQARGGNTELWFGWDLGLKLRQIGYEGGQIVTEKRLVSFTPGDGVASSEGQR